MDVPVRHQTHSEYHGTKCELRCQDHIEPCASEIETVNSCQHVMNDSYYGCDEPNVDSFTTGESPPRKRCTQHFALMVTPAKRSRATLHTCSHQTTNQGSDKYNIDHLEEVYMSMDIYDRFLLSKEEMKRRKIQDARIESLKAFTAKDHESDSFY